MAYRLIYIANIRVPTEKAHGLQIMQNCEAFADAGADVSLWTAGRFNTRAMRAIRDSWAYYSVKRNFRLRCLPTLDLIPLVPDRTDTLAQIIFYLQLWTFTLSALVGALLTRADVYYSRDALTIYMLSFVKPRRKLAYEAHRLAREGRGERLQRRAIKRVGTVIAITQALADDLVKLGADPQCVIVAHDGIRAARFENAPDKAEARRILGWPQTAYIVGYVGRLQTLAMDKGVSALVDALTQLDGAALAVVGGPDDMAKALYSRWIAQRLDPSLFLYAGQVKPDDVPMYLSAFDVCAMPHPNTEHFARHTSPLKLFEYMASRRPIVASDLPGFAEVVRDGTSALLVPPGDSNALAAAIKRLRDTPGLAEFLADSAYKRVMSRYTWAERAKLILGKLSGKRDGSRTDAPN
jgi:glycosyltransferase involved in cell wall biosynthesis